MSTKTDNPTVPKPVGFTMVSEAVRTLHGVRVQEQTVTVEYDCSDVRVWVHPDPIGCTELNAAIRDGRAWGLGALFADVSLSCGGGWFDINLHEARPEVTQAVAAAITHLYDADRRADVRSALRAIYRRIA